MSDLGNKEIFAKNLKYYMEYYNKDRSQVAEDIGIPYTTFNDWYNAVTYPRIDKIELLANYFNIQKSDLIENKYKNSNNLSDERQILFDKAKQVISDDDWATIEFIMKKTIDNYEKNKNND